MHRGKLTDADFIRAIAITHGLTAEETELLVVASRHSNSWKFVSAPPVVSSARITIRNSGWEN